MDNKEELRTQPQLLLDDQKRPKRICVVGNVDAGKSTLVACLSKNILDDGRGSARAKVLRHQHELAGGKSSSVATEIVGFDESEKQVLPSSHSNGNDGATSSKVWAEIASKSNHTLTLVDLCGHEKYLKTTVYGLVGYSPDLALLVVGSNAGFQKMSREHLQLLLALKVPFVIVFTKCDSMTPQHIAVETLEKVEKVLRNVQKKPYRVRNLKQIDQAVAGLATGRITPMFSVSSITGNGIDMLRTFLGTISKVSLQKMQEIDRPLNNNSTTDNTTDNNDQEKNIEEVADKNMPNITPPNFKLNSNSNLSEFVIDSNFLVPGVGVVAGGRLLSGTMSVGDRLLLGPDKVGAFRPVTVRSIHVACLSAQTITAGMAATLAIRSAPMDKGIAKSFPHTTIDATRDPLLREHARKGMVLVSGEETSRNLAVRDFEANVHCLHTSTTITCGYNPVVNIGTLCRSAKIVAINGLSGKDVCVRSGDTARLRFEFVHPERVTVGNTIVFREGRCRGVGQVVGV